jgi:hypothetical protein
MDSKAMVMEHLATVTAYTQFGGGDVTSSTDKIIKRW